ncbi:MAG: hypothetical protein LBP64_10975 [Tannerella sp.]|nr:hypothetical protein [Tannerella sp.]
MLIIRYVVSGASFPAGEADTESVVHVFAEGEAVCTDAHRAFPQGAGCLFLFVRFVAFCLDLSVLFVWLFCPFLLSVLFVRQLKQTAMKKNWAEAREQGNLLGLSQKRNTPLFILSYPLNSVT